MSVNQIDKEVVDLMLHASQSSYPNEFAGILRAEQRKITEILLLPGTYSSERSAFMRLDMLPISSKACGSVHSHPSNSSRPSETDLNFFGRFGEVHVIIAKPYTHNSWEAYDRNGKEVNLEVVKTKARKLESNNDQDNFWS